MESKRQLKTLWLKFYLDMANWGIPELSNFAGLSKPTIGRWISGSSPGIRLIQKCAEAINTRYASLDIPIEITISDLCDGKLEDPRLELMRHMEANFSSRQAIGDHFGISRARVGQLLGPLNLNEIQCLICGNTFKPGTISSRFCSNSCYNYYRTHGNTKWVSWHDRRLAQITQQIAPPNKEGCWEWQGAVSHSTGYGRICWEGKYAGAHRVIWQLVYGNIPTGLCVLHKCDNPPCVNPAHLFLGTPQDNARDRDSKGRGNSSFCLSQSTVMEIRHVYNSMKDIPALAKQFGVHPTTIYKAAIGISFFNQSSRLCNRKFTMPQVERIRDLYSYGNHSQRSLALMYHVSNVTIHNILCGRSYLA